MGFFLNEAGTIFFYPSGCPLPGVRLPSSPAGVYFPVYTLATCTAFILSSPSDCLAPPAFKVCLTVWQSGLIIRQWVPSSNVQVAGKRLLALLPDYYLKNAHQVCSQG